MTSQSTESSDVRPVDVLLVEDNPADVELTQRILQDSDFPLTVAVAEDGEVAMNMLRKVGVHSNSPRPDLILLDLNMPRKTGYEVLDEMNQDADLSRIPVLILTSTQAERDRLQFENVGPSRYCTKPLPIGRFNTIMGQLRSEEYVSWTALGNLDDAERESRILARYNELAELADAQRADRVLPLVRAEFDLFDDKLRALTVSQASCMAPDGRLLGQRHCHCIQRGHATNAGGCRDAPGHPSRAPPQRVFGGRAGKAAGLGAGPFRRCRPAASHACARAAGRAANVYSPVVVAFRPVNPLAVF